MGVETATAGTEFGAGWDDLRARTLDHLYQGVVVTDPKTLQENLQRRQGMEVIGSFAGGIAHDFNNILQAVGGYGGLLAAKLAVLDPVLAGQAEEIVKACERGTGLTRQLLALGREQKLELSMVPVDEAVSRMDAVTPPRLAS